MFPNSGCAAETFLCLYAIPSVLCPLFFFLFSLFCTKKSSEIDETAKQMAKGKPSCGSVMAKYLYVSLSESYFALTTYGDPSRYPPISESIQS